MVDRTVVIQIDLVVGEVILVMLDYGEIEHDDYLYLLVLLILEIEVMNLVTRKTVSYMQVFAIKDNNIDVLVMSDI